MFGLLDGIEELSEVDKNGKAAVITSPFFAFSLCSEKDILETNIWFEVIRTQLMMGLVELLKWYYMHGLVFQITKVLFCWL